MAKRNQRQDDTYRMQGRVDVQHALERVRQAATKDKRLRFTSLLHHVYSVNQLREAYFALKRDASPGIDGMTWQGYGEELEDKNSTSVSSVEATGRFRGVERILPKPTAVGALWASSPWRTSLSRERRQRC